MSTTSKSRVSRTVSIGIQCDPTGPSRIFQIGLATRTRCANYFDKRAFPRTLKVTGATLLSIEDLDVSHILGATRRALVAQQSLTSKEGEVKRVDPMHDSLRPGGLKLDTRHAREDVDPLRRHAYLDHLPRNLEIPLRERKRGHRRTKLKQRLPHAFRVRGRGFDQDTEIPGRARYTVRGHRVRPDHEKPSPRTKERRQHISKVLVHWLSRAGDAAG